jgi:hypothetical protein
VQLAAVPSGAAPADRLVPFAEGRRARHAEHRPPVHLESEQRRPDRNAVGEVPRAVDRIDDPDAVAGALAVLLPGDRVGREPGGDHLPDGGLHLEVRLGHGRQVRLLPDLELPEEIRHRDLRRPVGDLVCEGKLLLEHGSTVPVAYGALPTSTDTAASRVSLRVE